MMEIFGIPPEHVVEEATRKTMFFSRNSYTRNNMPKIIANKKGIKRYPGTKTLSNAIECSDQPFLDFLARCFEWDPKKRWDPGDATRHEWISNEMKLRNK